MSESIRYPPFWQRARSRLHADAPPPPNPARGADHETTLFGRYWSYIALILASVIVPLILFAAVAWLDRGNVLRKAERDVRDTTDFLFQHALHVFEAHELVATAVDARLRGMRWDHIAAAEEIHDYLADLTQTYPYLRAIFLIDPTGIVRNGSVAFPAAPVNVADRDYFAALREGDHGTFLGHLVRGHVTEDLNFNLVRRRGGSAVPFDGLIAVTASQDYFAAFWRKADPTAQSSTHLIRNDGMILSREPELASQRLTLAPGSVLTRALSGDEKGSFRATGDSGIDRLFAYRKIGNYNAVIVHGIGVHDALHIWRANLVTYGLFFGLSALALFLTSLAVLRQARRERLAVIRWRAATQRTTEEMERRIRAEEQLHQSQKLEALGQLVGNLAHDFNNLLFVVSANIGSLRGNQRTSDLEKKVELASDATSRAVRAVQSLLAFARRQPLRAHVFDPTTVLRDLQPLLRQCLTGKNDLVLALSPGTWPISADVNQLELAMVNLATNARDAMQTGGTLRIATENVRLRGEPGGLAGDFVAIAVSDTGPGIPPDVASRIFEPFFTTKESGKGTGLGLSQVYGFCTQSGGTAEVRVTSGPGATFVLYLPRAETEPPAPPRRPDSSTAAAPETPRNATGDPAVPEKSDRLRVLFAEDDPLVREVVTDMLHDQDADLTIATSGEEALAPTVVGTPDVPITNINLGSGIDGYALAHRARERWPRLAVMYVSGNPQQFERRAAAADRFIAKPFSTETLVRELRNLRARSAGMLLACRPGRRCRKRSRGRATSSHAGQAAWDDAAAESAR